MRSLSDFIEKHILELLNESQKDYIELQRRQLAETFRCVPSQINYVLQTRFTPERGFIVESRRGGGGYIRIVRLYEEPDWELVKAKLKTRVKRDEVQPILNLLVEEEIIQPDEARLIDLIIKTEEENLDDRLRAMLFRSLVVLLENVRR
ncbi:MAG: CtsR family transcriptional regulator [Bacillota bacterium]|mgnify:CR=1 FL=1|nr:CtsR family transcriptional regulator [Bacillota bacterium]NLU54905.1 CtsR family transcriptional regulator [Bacillota bacterium]HOA91812.1 CtsR family transcriptional regulator [Bacillota bacterium]HOL12738.1 CtsR family transcriptional regulator [Bacillota bacterium]HOP53202.1 CtsR family transcriptional regulator [Bacillota bacterium]